MSPILSICIPTYNRSIYLNNTLSQLTKEDVFQNTEDVEIIISDNCSTDNTEDICRSFQKKFGNKIIYYRQSENIKDKNFAFVLEQANGKYAKLNNDMFFFKKGELTKFVSFLKEPKREDIIFIPNSQKKYRQVSLCKNFNELLEKVSFSLTWIGGYCLKTNVFKKLEDKTRYAKYSFSQVDILFRLMEKGSKAEIYPGTVMQQVNVSQKGGYSIPEVFGRNYLNIINEIYEKGEISAKVYNKHKKELLQKHINKYSFNQKGTVYSHQGYIKYLLPFYWKNLYFYSSAIGCLFKRFFRAILEIRTDKNRLHKKIRFLFFKFNLPLKNKNKFIKYNCPKTNVEVGRYSYGTINALFNSNRSEKLIIGDFCSIAPNVYFIVSSEHPYRGLSTYPFMTKICGYEAEASSKGDIVIEDDVWIGLGAIICSGVKIGQGAIIAAGSVVTQDVPPYAIVAGNPGKVIKYRFSQAIINKLVQFKFSELTKEKIQSLRGALYKEITEENCDKLLEEFQRAV